MTYIICTSSACDLEVWIYWGRHPHTSGRHLARQFCIKPIAVADLGGAGGAHPPYGPKFSQFHAVFQKTWQFRMLVPPLDGWSPLLRGILDPPLYIGFLVILCSFKHYLRTSQKKKFIRDYLELSCLLMSGYFSCLMIVIYAVYVKYETES